MATFCSLNQVKLTMIDHASFCGVSGKKLAEKPGKSVPRCTLLPIDHPAPTSSFHILSRPKSLGLQRRSAVLLCVGYYWFRLQGIKCSGCVLREQRWPPKHTARCFSPSLPAFQAGGPIEWLPHFEERQHVTALVFKGAAPTTTSETAVCHVHHARGNLHAEGTGPLCFVFNDVSIPTSTPRHVEVWKPLIRCWATAKRSAV